MVLIDVNELIIRMEQDMPCYIDITTGDILYYNQILKNSTRYLKIPQLTTEELSKWEYQFLQNNRKLKSKLNNLTENDFEIKFHYLINDFNLYNDWQSYKEKKLKLIITSWCKNNNIQVSQINNYTDQ